MVGRSAGKEGDVATITSEELKVGEASPRPAA